MKIAAFLYISAALALPQPALAQDTPPTNLIECLQQCIDAYPDRSFECSTSCDLAFGLQGRENDPTAPPSPRLPPLGPVCFRTSILDVGSGSGCLND